MGQKPKHPNPLSEVDAYAALELMVDLVRKNKWTVTQVQKMLLDFMIRRQFTSIKQSDLDLGDADADFKTIKSSAFQGKMPNDWLIWVFFLFLKECYGNELQNQQIGEQLKRKEVEVQSPRSLLVFSNAVEADAVVRLSGSYKLYRPFHLDPINKIMISGFQIGVDGNVFSCKMHDGYRTRSGIPNEDVFEGKIVPLGDKMMAVLSSPLEFEASVILHFDDVASSLKNGSLSAMRGIVLTAVGNGPASAWPIFASRIDTLTDFTPSVIDASEYHTLPEPVQESLYRGAVHWHYKHFPKPYSNSGPSRP